MQLIHLHSAIHSTNNRAVVYNLAHILPQKYERKMHNLKRSKTFSINFGYKNIQSLAEY